jgi:hypothetical protein
MVVPSHICYLSEQRDRNRWHSSYARISANAIPKSIHYVAQNNGILLPVYAKMRYRSPNTIMRRMIRNLIMLDYLLISLVIFT